jgi:uncharacterized protein YvpB
MQSISSKAEQVKINLIDFFKYYDETKPTHVAAVGLLSQAMSPDLRQQNAVWVTKFRNGNAFGGIVDLHKFFEFFSERNPNHVAAIEMLQQVLPKELLSDTAKWVEKYREKPTIPAVLPVPYYNQIDNYRDAHRTCNSSACAMCLEYFKPGTLVGTKGDDAYVKKVFAIGDTTDHAVQTKVLAGYGIKSHFSYNLSFADLDRELAAGKPVIIGILHRGSLSSPTGGHMVVVVGKRGSDYIINDPYGTLNDQYTSAVANGKHTVYTKSVLQRRWCPKGNDGWGRIFDHPAPVKK